jgi:hypothetical protein
MSFKNRVESGEMVVIPWQVLEIIKSSHVSLFTGSDHIFAFESGAVNSPDSSFDIGIGVLKRLVIAGVIDV